LPSRSQVDCCGENAVGREASTTRMRSAYGARRRPAKASRTAWCSRGSASARGA
jgi:hypothetical protein